MQALSFESVCANKLGQLNSSLAKAMKGDVLFMKSDIVPPLDGEFRVMIENVRERSQCRHLVIVLETRGGFMETAERLVETMRHHYEEVSFVIPSHAYSAGTVLALSGNRIYMDYFSVLGPIDPQYRLGDGSSVSGYGMLQKFQDLMEVVNEATSEHEVRAELMVLLKKFDPAQIFAVEQAIQHGITLITEWLPKYKFKDWTYSKTNRANVTECQKKKRAEEIAITLGKASKWHSHGRGISKERLTGKDLKLKIDDFGADCNLNKTVRDYHGLAISYFMKLAVGGFLHHESDFREVPQL